jgi:hypothetical protein
MVRVARLLVMWILPPQESVRAQTLNHHLESFLLYPVWGAGTISLSLLDFSVFYSKEFEVTRGKLREPL